MNNNNSKGGDFSCADVCLCQEKIKDIMSLEAGVLNNRLLPYIKDQIPSILVENACDDFFPDSFPENIKQTLLASQFFTCFFVFNWISFQDFNVREFVPSETVAYNYLKEFSACLSAEERNFIRKMMEVHYSYFYVLEVCLDNTIVVKDVFLETRHIVRGFHKASNLEKGVLIFGKLLTFNDEAFFAGVCPYVIPSTFFQPLLALRKLLVEENDGQMLSAEALLNELIVELFDVLFDIIEDIYKKSENLVLI